MERKYGKRLINRYEAYNGKTVSWTGKFVSNLGGAKITSDDDITDEWGINGVRGIMLRALYHGN